MMATSTKAPEEIAHPAREEIELGAVLHALSDPVRLKIVAYLARSDDAPTCGSFDVPVTKSTCTHHFKVLREAGVIKQRQDYERQTAEDRQKAERRQMAQALGIQADER